MYRFMGVYREQLWFYSPNLAGCFLVMTALFSLGLFIFLLKRKRVWLRYSAVLPLLTGTVSIFILGCTYSRGGYVGFVAGLVFFILCLRSKWAVLWGGIFALSLLILENGAARVASAAEISEGSIMNRLLLWRGGMAVIADHFVSGIGLNSEIGTEYVRWFKPLWLNENYNYLLNDFLTLAAGWGIFAAGGILCGVAVLFWWGWRCCRDERSPLLAGILAALAGFAACTLFSNMMFEDLLLYSAAGLAAIALIWELIFIIAGRRWKELKLTWIPLSGTVLFCAVFLAACFYVRSCFPYRYRYLTDEKISLHAMPDRGKTAGVVIFATEHLSYYYANDPIHQVIRPLVEAGYEVYYEGVSGGYDDLAKAEKFLDFAVAEAGDRGVTVFADSTGGKQLFIAAVRSGRKNIERIIINDIPSEWPFPELSAVEYAKDLSVPVTFMMPLSDGSRPLYKALLKHGKTFTEYARPEGATLADALIAALQSASKD